MAHAQVAQRTFVALAPTYNRFKKDQIEDHNILPFGGDVSNLISPEHRKRVESAGVKSICDVEKYVRRIANKYDPLSSRDVERIYAHLDKLKCKLEKDPTNERLLKMFQRHYQRSKDILVRHNQRMVVTIANRYASKAKGLNFADLMQEGNIGLMWAIDRFDYKKGYKFSTYAVWWIKEKIDRATKNQARLIRIPIGRLQKKVKVQKAFGFGFTDLKTELDSKQIAAITGLSHKEVLEMKTYDYDIESMDKKIGQDGDSTLGDRLADSTAVNPYDSAIMSDIQLRLIAKLDSVLSPADARFIKRRFGLGGQHERTDSQLADLEGVRDSEVKKRLKNILEVLKTKIDLAEFSFE